MLSSYDGRMEASGYIAGGNVGIRVSRPDPDERRRVQAEVFVHATVEDVWGVLTDYQSLAEFVPNLEHCEVLPPRVPGRARIRQRGCSQSLFWRLQAEAVLEVWRVERGLGARELRFVMLEGDFQEFSGCWVVEPDPSASPGAAVACILRYELLIIPALPIPASIVSHVVRLGLPANMEAVARRAEELASRRARAPGFAAGALEADAPLPPGAPRSGSGSKPEVMPAKGRPSWSRSRRPWEARSIPLGGGPATIPQPRRRLPSGYLGTDTVPLPPASPNSHAGDLQRATALDFPRLLSPKATYPAFSVGGWGNAGSAAAPAMTEVHLRRLDDDELVHRRCVASLEVDAPPEVVWGVLTDYEALPSFVPNLAVCERIELPRGTPDRVVRLRQVGFRQLAYMLLHAEAVVDLVEKPPYEVQFRQVSGDFHTLQGKWMVSEAETYSASGNTRSVVKWAMEVRIPASTPVLGLLEPLLERCVYEDLPANLAAVKARCEGAARAAGVGGQEKRQGRPRLRDMLDSWPVLAAELQRCYGETRTVPRAAALRAASRSDLEKAITKHGGGNAVAARLGWEFEGRGKRRRGYWDVLQNVKAEIDAFIAEQGLPPGVMPLKREMVEAGRHDLARAVERWAGLYELGQELGYAPGCARDGRLREAGGGADWGAHIAEVAQKTGLSGRNGLFELAAKTYRRGGVSDEDLTEELLLELLEAERTTLQQIGDPEAAKGLKADLQLSVPQKEGTTGKQESNAVQTRRRDKSEGVKSVSSLRKEIDEW